MRSLSKTGAKMHPFEPQFLLQGASHGKSALLLCSNGACEETDKADFFTGGGSWWYELISVEILSATTMATTTKMIEYLQNERITPEGMTGQGTGDGVESAALPAPSLRGRAHRSREIGIIGRGGQ